MSIVETFHGYIETTQDTLLIFEACRRGLLPRICRRLQEKERRIVQSGTVFVFDERESGIKRWTDGLVWSPSRILGNFLVYRELDKRNASGKKDASPIDRASRSSSSSDVESALEKNKERALVGSLTNSYRFKKNGLVKKTMSIVVNGVSQHLISYYSKDDVLAGKLRTPSSVPELAGLEISPEFLMKQNFRIPPTVEQSYDFSDHMQSPVSTNHSPRTPSGPFHTMGANGADFTSAGFGNHVRPKEEPGLVTSPLDVFTKPYHHQQQTHHHLHTQPGYHGMAPLTPTQHHHASHPYSPQQATFPPTFSYGPVSNSNGTAVSGPQDQLSTTPPSLRYLPRSNQSFMYPNTSQGQSPQSTQAQTAQQQRHSLSPGQYGAGSPAMMMPSPGTPGANGHLPTHDFNLSMGYHSPATTSPSTFGGLPAGSPQSTHAPTQHHHHQSLPSSQGWNDFSYSSYTAPPMSDHHDQHDHGSVSP
ncbi:hypothetical protein BGW38_005656 [Lunasporangiospora selenospora]|uniref:Gti1/Pac2 family protein n=1 Tax=Lunasporangiospora selenospora TaxID=979761 RepID=A0A9P6FN53_9FUNG|nr:hypothetical protein BGW38_005656 [Lunasporangiospora selenospora]